MSDRDTFAEEHELTESLTPDCSTAGTTMFGITFARDTLDELVEEAARGPQSGQGVRLTVTANVDHIVLLRKTPALVAAYHHAWRRTIDGFPVFRYARMRRLNVPQRITGADLFPKLLRRLVPGRHRLFLVVADNQISGRMLEWAQENGFGDAIKIVVPPFGFENDALFGAKLAAEIQQQGTTHLIFGVGCPRSEVWIDQHRSSLGDCYAFAVGAAISFFVGTTHRAPKLVQKIGMEWAWRMLDEPRRLSRRYLFSSWGFCLAIRDDLTRNEVTAQSELT